MRTKRKKKGKTAPKAPLDNAKKAKSDALAGPSEVKILAVINRPELTIDAPMALVASSGTIFWFEAIW